MLPYFLHSVSFEFIDGLTMDQVCENVAGLGSDSVILMLSFSRDAAGRVFTPEDALAKVYASTDAPIYGVWEHLLGKGIVGGRLTSGRIQGRQAAALLVVRPGGGYGGGDRLVDLRVDDHVDPVPRLAELLDLHRLYFGEVDEDALLPLEGEVATRALTALIAAGRLPQGHAAWDDAAEAALRGWAGVENLEERFRGPGRIDPMVLQRLTGD